MAYHGCMSLGEPEAVVQIGVCTVDMSSQLCMELRSVCTSDCDFWGGRARQDSNG